MLDLFQIAASADACKGLLPIVKMVVYILKIIQILIPIALILF